MKRYIFALLGLSLFLFAANRAAAQTRIMPVGNSLTWGMVNNNAPPIGDEGYRKPLYNLCAADANLFPSGVTFVGDSGTYAGWYKNGAKIGAFLSPDSALGDMTVELNQYSPDIVLLHVGTNNIGEGTNLGNYNQPTTVIGQLYRLVKKIIDHSSVDHLFLCYIVPKYSTPGEEAEVRNYNNAITIMLDDISNDPNFYKITPVDMWTPFNAKKNDYYNLDVDKIHLNPQGYQHMAEIFHNYMQRELQSSLTDEFNRVSLGSDWKATAGISILDKGENGGGALQFTATGDLLWNNLAVWKKTANLTTVSMRAHGDATAADLPYVGIAVGLDSLYSQASGYLVWIYQNQIHIKTIDHGNANTGLDINTSVTGNSGISTLLPGESLKVSYQHGQTENRFSVSIPGRLDEPLNFSDPNKRAGTADTLYSGIMFRGNTGSAFNYLIDSYTVESQLPDPIPPGAPTAFSAFSAKKTSVLLTWEAPGNDGYAPNTRAASYDMRYSTSHITEDNWNNATIVPQLPTPGVKGTTEELDLTGLSPETRYYVRILAVDEWGNKSDLSDEIEFATKVAGFRWDLFARQAAQDGSIGSDWAIDPNEYTIDYNSGIPEESALVNYATDYEWGRVAVFKAVPDPLIVKLVWGRNATQQGIFRGGMALLLDSPTISANGYMLFIRSTQYADKVYLYNIQNGAVITDESGKIDEAAYTLYEGGALRLPQANDTMTVVIDRYDASGTKFDVKLNSQPITDQPLYDSQRRHNTQVNYSGVMLGRLNKANPVQAFGASSTINEIKDIVLVQGNDVTSKVGEEMSDSLLAKVIDTNGSPMPNIPVSFWTLSPSDASVTAPASCFNFDPIVFEAEWDFEVEGTYSTYDDENASGGKYMNATTGGAGAGELNYTFYVDKDTTYYFWGRIIASSMSSMAVQIDVTSGGTTNSWQWDCNYYGSSNQFSTSWRWDRVRNATSRTTPVSMRLRKGECEIKVTKLHSNVKLDRFLITSSSSYVPPQFLSKDVLMTDGRGMAGTKLTLGEAIGANRVRVSAFGTSILKTFEVNGVASDPTRVVPANQNQTHDNWARQPLPKPFEVTLYDQYDNVVKGVPVVFDVIQGDGTISADKDTTDSNGKASTLMTLGFDTTTNIVHTTFPGTLLDPVNFYGKADKGLAADIQSMTSSTGQKHYIGQQFNNFLKVKVLNDQQQPMVNVPVQFEALGIPATFGNVTKYTNSEGIVQDTLKLGDETGVLQVKAYSVGVSRIVYTDSVYNRATRILYQQGNNLVVHVGETTQMALRVRVYNDLVYAANQPVKFVAKNFALNGFHFPGATGNGDTITVYTVSNGLAETKVIAGPKHGLFTDIIEAQATDGFYPVQHSPIKFSLRAKSDASSLVYVSGNNQEGVVGSELIDPLRVKMLTLDSQPVVGQPVIFKITQGDGKFTMTNYTEYTAETDNDGIAEVAFQLGKKVGDENVNIVQALATNGERDLGNVPIEFKLYAKSSNADSMAAISADTLKGTVGKVLSQKIQVRAYGTLGEPAVGAKVKFSVIKGGGAVTAAGDTTTTVTISKADGIAEVNWTLGTKMGTANHKLQVNLLDDNGDDLKGSPHYFYASANPDVVDTLASVVQATGPRQASGADSSLITITLNDKYGNPVANKWVDIEVTPRLNSYYNGTVGPTDALGQAKGYLVSTSAGEKIVRAKVHDGVTIKKTVTVIFLANDATKITKVTSSTPAGNLGTVYRDSLVVRITDDQDNPVAYGPVLFRAVSDGAFVVDTTGAFVKSFKNYSNAQGYASFYAVLANAVGENIYEVSGTDINNDPLQGSPVTFSVSGKVGTAISMYRVSQATVTGVAGKNLDAPLSVGVYDVSGDPVANVPVEFKVIEGNGKVQASGPVGTNAYGHAEVAFQADTDVSKKDLVTASASLSGSPVLFTINSKPDVAYQVSYASDAIQLGVVGGSTTQNLKVLVEDRYGNPVSGYRVYYEIQSGSATIHNGSTASDTSDANGYVSMPLKLGTATGTVKVKATGAYLLGAPLIFTIYPQPVDAVNIVRYPASNSTIIGTKGHELIDPLRVMVVDEYGNPVPNVTVLFAASDNNTGDGYIVETGPVTSDENGIASAHYVCSTTGSAEQARALLADKDVTFNIQGVNNPNTPSLDRAIWLSKNFEVFEGDLLRIPVRANPEGDGDPLTFEIVNLFPPTGMRISVQAQNSTAMIEWTPTNHQQGAYKIYVRVSDGKGGADMDSLNIIVKDMNLDPMIVNWAPRIDTTMTSGQTVRFWVEAYDPDDDPLHYAWYTDNIPEGEDSPLLEFFVDRYYKGVMSVRVIVSDGYTTTQFQFSPNFITTSIELAEFVASYDMWEQTIQLDWRTFTEFNNAGFYIARCAMEDGEYEQINQNLISGNMLQTYQFIDKEIRAGSRYYYKLIDVDDNGFEFEHGPIMVSVPVPDKFALYQNFPNPFNPSTKIRYQLPHRTDVKLVLYNMMGQKVRTLVDEVKEAGFYTVTWDGKDASGRQTSTGIYIYRFSTPDQTFTKRLVKMQ